MGVFRLHGQTVIATAKAPIGRSENTLLYGSDDGGHTFLNLRAETIEPVVDALGQKLGTHLS
jgi:hypothetical protein